MKVLITLAVALASVAPALSTAVWGQCGVGSLPVVTGYRQPLIVSCYEGHWIQRRHHLRYSHTRRLRVHLKMAGPAPEPVELSETRITGIE